MDSLDRINLRLDWARFHLEKLKDEVDAFTAGKPYSTRQETYVEGDYEVIELRMLIERQPPDILSLIMGDFVHNLRSLLDHIAWSMIPAGSKPQQPRNIAFPIFAKASGSEPCFDIDGRRMIQELRPEAKSIFESLQPYQGWKPSTRSPLWILNKLWNIDKHRNIMPVTLYHSPAKFPVLYPPGIVRHIKTTPEIDRDNAIIAWLYIPQALNSNTSARSPQR